MNIAQHSVEIEREVGNLGVMSWLSRHQPLPSANETWLGTNVVQEDASVILTQNLLEMLAELQRSPFARHFATSAR